MEQETTYTAFVGEMQIASGAMETMLSGIKARFDQDQGTPFLIFEDQPAGRWTTTSVAVWTMCWHAYCRNGPDWVLAVPGWAWCHGKSLCCRAIGIGWNNNRTAPRRRCGDWSTRRENGSPDRAWQPWRWADSCRRWPGISPAVRRRAARSTPGSG